MILFCVGLIVITTENYIYMSHLLNTLLNL